MKIFFWYAGTLVALYFLALFYFLLTRPHRPADSDSMAWLTIYGLVGGAALIVAILTGGATILLWKKFITKDPAASNVLLALSAIWLVMLIQSVISNRSMLYETIRGLLSVPARDSVTQPRNPKGD